MSDESVGGVHWSFWVIGVVGLGFNLMGCVNFLSQMDADRVASMPEAYRAIVEGRPAWATGGFAIGVFGGALGCFLLLLRKSIAFYVFIASLIGIIVTMIHTTNVATSVIDFTHGEIFVMVLLPIIVAAMLIWYSKQAMRKSWIK